MAKLNKLTLYYDGACPLCQAEILFLSSRNQDGLLNFVDIQSSSEELNRAGVSCDEALASMMAQYEDGRVIQGVSVFPEAYRRARLPLLAWIFSRQSLQPLFHYGYRFFAKNRHSISRVLGPVALWLVTRFVKKTNP